MSLRFDIFILMDPKVGIFGLGLGQSNKNPNHFTRSMSTAKKSAFAVTAGLVSFGVGLSCYTYYLVTTSAATTFGVDFFGKKTTKRRRRRSKIGCPLCRAKTGAICKDATSKNLCCICMEAKSTILLECGHICLCKDCYLQIPSYKAPKN